MKKPSVVTLSMELYYKSSLTAAGARNIKILRRMPYILGSCRLQLYVEFY